MLVSSQQKKFEKVLTFVYKHGLRMFSSKYERFEMYKVLCFDVTTSGDCIT